MRKVCPLLVKYYRRRRSKRRENVRYWLTPKGLAAIGKDGDGQPKPAALLSEYLH